MDSSELWLGRGKIVEYRGERYTVEEFDSSIPGQNTVRLKPTPQGQVDRFMWRSPLVEQRFFGEITPWKP